MTCGRTHAMSPRAASCRGCSWSPLWEPRGDPMMRAGWLPLSRPRGRPRRGAHKDASGRRAATPRRTHARTRNAGEVPRRPRRRRGRASRSADPVTCAFGPTLPRRRPRDAPAFGATPPPSSTYSAGASRLVLCSARRAARRAAVTRPPTRAPARARSNPSAEVGPVERPPWFRQRPPRPMPAAAQSIPARAPLQRAPQRPGVGLLGVVARGRGSSSGRRCSMR